MSRRGGVARREFIARVGAGFAAGGLPPPAPGAVANISAEPVADLDELESAVQSVIAGRRIGRPVFVRLTLHGAAADRDVMPRLGRLVACAARWLGRRLDSVYAAGSADSGQVGLALRFRHGATALVSYARGHDRDGGVDLLVVGNRGTVTYDATADPVGPGTAKAPTKLLALLKRALRSGRAEAAGDDEQP